MQRIFVTGNAGCGKTSLSKHLSKLLVIQYFGLDQIVWQPGWNITAVDERTAQIAEITKRKKWIIDGVSKDVLKAADTIILLDFSRITSYIRVLKRNWRYMFKSRPDLPKNCPEILILKRLVRIIWDFPSQVRPYILDYMRENTEVKNIFHITSNEELNAFISMLESKGKIL